MHPNENSPYAGESPSRLNKTDADAMYRRVDAYLGTYPYKKELLEGTRNLPCEHGNMEQWSGFGVHWTICPVCLEIWDLY